MEGFDYAFQLVLASIQIYENHLKIISYIDSSRRKKFNVSVASS